jgi:hypothetical protein
VAKIRALFGGSAGQLQLVDVQVARDALYEDGYWTLEHQWLPGSRPLGTVDVYARPPDWTEYRYVPHRDRPPVPPRHMVDVPLYYLPADQLLFEVCYLRWADPGFVAGMTALFEHRFAYAIVDPKWQQNYPDLKEVRRQLARTVPCFERLIVEEVLRFCRVFPANARGDERRRRHLGTPLFHWPAGYEDVVRIDGSSLSAYVGSGWQILWASPPLRPGEKWEHDKK